MMKTEALRLPPKYLTQKQVMAPGLKKTGNQIKPSIAALHLSQFMALPGISARRKMLVKLHRGRWVRSSRNKGAVHLPLRRLLAPEAGARLVLEGVLCWSNYLLNLLMVVHVSA